MHNDAEHASCNVSRHPKRSPQKGFHEQSLDCMPVTAAAIQVDLLKKRKKFVLLTH